MNRAKRTWAGDWRAKIVSRIRDTGYQTVMDFLAAFPGEPYINCAQRLGDDVAADQLECMHFEEAHDADEIRGAAMDALVRELRYHLANGWPDDPKGDFRVASAYADWVVEVQQKEQELKPKAKQAWETLKELRPPVGWSPSGPDDQLIVKAFSTAWPKN